MLPLLTCSSPPSKGLKQAVPPDSSSHRCGFESGDHRMRAWLDLHTRGIRALSCDLGEAQNRPPALSCPFFTPRER